MTSRMRVFRAQLPEPSAYKLNLSRKSLADYSVTSVTSCCRLLFPTSHSFVLQLNLWLRDY
jgi:hypothetical protein